MNKEMILNLLRQYGFGLNQKDPYLYDGELGLGIVYTFKDPFYGILTRVYQAPSLKEYEDFLNKYSWYKKNGQKTRVKICLENYKEIVANPKFIYQGKEKNYQELQDIEEKSTLKSIVTYEHYKENEEKRIVEKYAMIPDLDMRTVGDFLAEFDNIKFEEMTYTSEEKEEYSFEEIMEEVESDYQNRSKEEQDFLVGYSYLLNVIKTNRVSEFFNMLRNPNNVMVRVKYFQDIDFTSENKCALTIKKYMKKINSIISYPLIGNLNVFFIDNKIMTSDKVIKASSKKAQAPVLTNGDEVTYVCNLKKGISTYFIPCELKEDIYNDGNLILASDRSLFLIDLSNLVIKKDNDDMLKVVQYEMVKEMKEDYLQAADFKSKKILMYRNITIERGNEI